MNYSLANLSNRQRVYIDAVTTHAPSLGIDTNKDQYSRAELRQVSMVMKGKKWIPNWITHDQTRRVGRGIFLIPEIMEAMGTMAVTPGSGHEGDELADTAPTTDHGFIEDDPQVDMDQQAMQEMMS